MSAFLLSVHILAAIIGLGPTFSFAFLGIMAERQPAAARALQETILTISTRLVIPLVVTLGLSGLLLIGNTHDNLSKNPWLGAGIVLYVLVLAVAIFYQVPTQKKILALLGPTGGMDQPEVRKLATGQRVVGISMGLAIVATAVLMVWKPGAPG
ncbi:MAG: putative integral rane protein [Actinomycetota bacterium]|nr:putative integral rane protein [Actinomycetota bacterium]